MELIKKLPVEKNKSGNYIYYGIFLCPYCLKEVKKLIYNGLKAESCGCHWKKRKKIKTWMI